MSWGEIIILAHITMALGHLNNSYVWNVLSGAWFILAMIKSYIDHIPPT